MFNTIEEIFLSQYFLIDTVAGKFIKDMKKLFFELSKVYFVQKKRAEELFDLTESEVVKDIATEKDFMQYQRLQQYCKLAKVKVDVGQNNSEIIVIKGNAIVDSNQCKLLPNIEVSASVQFDVIKTAADCGIVNGLKVLGILQCLGLMCDKNFEEGISNLSKGADWNDITCLLALLYFNKDAREYNLARLGTLTANGQFEMLALEAAKNYGVAIGPKDEEVELLQKAFAFSIVKKDEYNATYARILHSSVLDMKERQNLILYGDKQTCAAASHLPIMMSSAEVEVANDEGIRAIFLKRELEQEKILSAMSNIDLVRYDDYRPICLSCSSPYVLKMYAKALKKSLSSSNVEVVDISKCMEFDLEPTMGNVFVRNAKEDKSNCYFLHFYGSISDMKMTYLQNILIGEKRAKFHLMPINITLDMRRVLPICFCDSSNESKLKAFCDVIQLQPVSQEEKPFVIFEIVNKKMKKYGVEIVVDGEIKEIFADYDVDMAERVIDTAVKAKRVKGGCVTLTRAMIDEYANYELNGKIKFGFGA